MSLESLVLSAEKLRQPSEAAIRAFDSKIDKIADELSRIMVSRPDIERLIGPDNEPMMMNNSRNYLRFMGAVFHNTDARVLVETSVWAFRTYRAHGFRVAYWPANLDTTVQILRQEISEPMYSEIYPFFEWLIVHIPEFCELSGAGEEKKQGPDTLK
jgi:hypothetical protein